MSSLLQHTGRIAGGRVELFLYLQHETRHNYCSACGERQATANDSCQKCGETFASKFINGEMIGEPGAVYLAETTRKVDSEPVTVNRANGNPTTQPRLYRIWRKPAGMFGAWVVFRWAGAEHCPDLSCPIAVDKLPRDARPISDDDARGYWFK